MSQKFVFTFYEPLPALDMVGERILVSIWRAAWAKAGLSPIVLSEYWASRHPIYREFDQAVSKLPSSNPENYDRSCFLRWLAVQVAAKEYPNDSGRIVMLDYDVMPGANVSKLNLDWALGDPYQATDPMYSLHGNCPALVIGTPEQFAEVCQYFIDYVPPAGLKHQSDQYLFEQMIIANPDKFKVSMDVVLYSEPGWETASAIHFSNSVMQPNYIPKHEWIPKLRPL